MLDEIMPGAEQASRHGELREITISAVRAASGFRPDVRDPDETRTTNNDHATQRRT
jgi:hypothetical protein